jgi:hypothetical protein
VCKERKGVNLSPADRLGRLKTSVKHIGNLWVLVLHRRTYLRAFGRSQSLGEVINNTYAANVHNTLQDVLLLDLIREIGALILDRDDRSASIASVVTELRDSDVLGQIEAVYRIVPPVPKRFVKGDNTDAETRARIAAAIHASELDTNLKELAALPGRLGKIDQSVLQTPIAEMVRKLRNKGVAHYDVVQDGADWKMWRERETGLTYGQLDEFVDSCTVAIDDLSRLVRGEAFDFEGTIGVAQNYADNYISALIAGLHQKRREDDARRLQLREESEALRGRSEGSKS